MSYRLKHQLARKNKFNATKAVVDGVKFDSKKEAQYYMDLKLRKNSGEVIQFLRQVPFHLPGGVKYTVDFMELRSDGSIHFIDVKGYSTREFIMKKKIVEELYAPIEIEVV